MTLVVVVLWGVVAWCGTRAPRPRPLPPPNGPNPFQLAGGIIGGLAAAIATYYAFGLSEVGAIEFVATSISAFFGAFFVSDIIQEIRYNIAKGKA